MKFTICRCGNTYGSYWELLLIAIERAYTKIR
jgi:hypothetical protein